MSDYRAKLLADSPLAYWRMNEASGNLVDSSGNSKTATAAGTAATYLAPSLVPNENDRSIRFADNTNRFDAGDDADFELQTFSVEAWVYRTGTTPSTQNIMSKWATDGWRFSLLNTGTFRFHLRFNALTADSILAANTPYHVVATVTPTTINLYVNGVLDGTGAGATINYATETVMVGNDNNLATGFVGILDEVAFYTTELTAVQVANHYNVDMPWAALRRVPLLARNPALMRERRQLIPASRTLLRSPQTLIPRSPRLVR